MMYNPVNAFFPLPPTYMRQMTIDRLEGEVRTLSRQLEDAEKSFKDERVEVLRLFEGMQHQEKQASRED